MKDITAAAAAYTIFIKKAFIFVIKITIDVMTSTFNQIINEAFTFIISTRLISISIDFSLEHVLFNDITIYEINAIIFQLIIAMYDYSDI